jgi:Rieske Fe-S protein
MPTSRAHDTELDREESSPPISHAARRGDLKRVVTRRTFIVWYLAGLLVAIVAAITAPLLVFLYPPVKKNAKIAVSVTLDTAVDAIREGQAVQFNAPPTSGFVMTDGGGVNAAGNITFGGYLARSHGQLRAFAITCPHLGCSYGLNADSTRFLCPCHGSQFSLAGQVLHGPAVNPLSHLAWRQGDQPNLVVIDGQDVSQ